MEAGQIKLLWITEGGENHAPTRHRALIYEKHLQGLVSEVHFYRRHFSFKETREKCAIRLARFFKKKTVLRPLSSAWAEWERAKDKLRQFLRLIRLFRCHNRVIYLRCFPSLYQSLLLRLFRMIVYFDFDDALFLERPSKVQDGQCREGAENRAMAAKLGSFISRCRAVIVSNDYLANWARCHNPRVFILPTSVEIPVPLPARQPVAKGLVLGWMGAPENQKYLFTVMEAILAVLEDRPDLSLHVITSDFWQYTHPRIRCIKWTLETWEKEMGRFHIGLAPLDDSPWTRGKMQFKAIQYAAQGVPVVGSRTGFDLNHWRHGENILFAETPGEYLSCLRDLLQSPGRRDQIGRAGLETVRLHYSASVNAVRLAEYLED